MGKRKWGILNLKLFPEYIFLCYAKCFEFFSGTFYHCRWPTYVEFFIFTYSLCCNPVSDVSLSLSLCTDLCPREVLYVFKVLEICLKTENLVFVETIFEFAYSEYECDFFCFFISHRVSKRLAVYRCKSCTRSDKTLGSDIILEHEVSKWKHPRKYHTNLSVTYYRTSTTVGNPFYY